ncbi:MAG: sporulation protein YtxC [Clostridia bacterium]
MGLNIATMEYKIDITRLFLRRLKDTGADLPVSGKEDSFTVQIASETDFEACISATTELILMDISQFEIAKLVNDIPFELEARREILKEAIRYAKNAAMRTPVRRDLTRHFKESENLVLEGFIRFRMHETALIWERAVDKAAEEYLISLEQRELNLFLSEFANLRESIVEEVTLILTAEGNCILTDDSNSRIEYGKDGFDVLISVLVSLSPGMITVYDLSMGDCDELIRSIDRVFNERVRVYVAASPPIK